MSLSQSIKSYSYPLALACKWGWQFIVFLILIMSALSFFWKKYTGGRCARVLSRVRLFVTPWAVPARLLCPWGFPGKNTGVGGHFLLQCVKVKSLSRVWLLALVLPINDDGMHNWNAYSYMFFRLCTIVVSPAYLFLTCFLYSFTVCQIYISVVF